MDQETLITLTADIAAAHLANNEVEASEVPRLVQAIHGALASLRQVVEEVQADKVPVVSVRGSVRPDYIVCLECGRKQKMLRRHLQTAHGMSPEQYRRDYGLPSTYPMVAANYSERRRDLAKAIGLGRKKEGEARFAQKPSARSSSGEGDTAGR